VTTVKIFYYERPSALPAVCTLVFDVPAPLAAASAHGLAVGDRAVQSGPAVGASRIQVSWTQLKGRGVRAYGATGIAAQGSTMVVQAVDVVGGVPPRGRPV
jgi:hypothetical protein